MNHLLAVDIGNTNITVGIFKSNKLTLKGKIPTYKYSIYESHLKKFVKRSGLRPADIDGIIVSSVVPLALARLIIPLSKIFKSRIYILGKDIKAPIRNLYKRKADVGADRLVNAFAAKMLYGSPCVIIDFGTAITFDIVSRKGEYLGGLILPGIEISLCSLFERTALLPKVELRPARHIIGKDTVNSMRGGILFGFGAMCDGLVAEYRKRLGRGMKVIVTGGNARLIKRYARSIRIVDEDLTLKGLQLIFENFS